MRRAGSWLAALGGSIWLAAAAAADPPLFPIASPPGSAAAAPSAAIPVDDQALRALLEKLTALSDRIAQAPQSADVWRLHLEGADLQMQIAGLSKPDERDNWLRMAADSFYSAAITSPDNDPTAVGRLGELPDRIVQVFPGSPVASFAALRDIEADCTRLLMKSSDHPELVQGHRRDRLLRFAQEFPTAPEAPKAVLEAAKISEALGRTDDARTCYRYLADHFPSDPLARKVNGALWRMGVNTEPLSMALPLLFSPLAPDAPRYNLQFLRGRIVVVYFWASTCPQAAEDFAALKQLTDRYRDRGLEILYVNMDKDPNQGRAFLAGRLTAGEHLYQAGGVDGPIAERYGIQNLPEAFLVGRDGTVLRHSLRATQLEPEINGLLPRR
jgi:thiol-disulfide isomerase/thioredoxin